MRTSKHGGGNFGGNRKGPKPESQHRCGSPPALRFLSATRSISQQAHCSIFLIGKELQPSALRARTTLTRTSSGATRGPICRPWRETEHAASPSLVLVRQDCAEAAPSAPAGASAAPWDSHLRHPVLPPRHLWPWNRRQVPQRERLRQDASHESNANSLDRSRPTASIHACRCLFQCVVDIRDRRFRDCRGLSLRPARRRI